MKDFYFKNKRQQKDFEKMFKKICFDVEDCFSNGLGAIIVNLEWLESQYFEELENLIKNEKNIFFNRQRKKLVIE